MAQKVSRSNSKLHDQNSGQKNGFLQQIRLKKNETSNLAAHHIIARIFNCKFRLFTKFVANQNKTWNRFVPVGPKFLEYSEFGIGVTIWWAAQIGFFNSRISKYILNFMSYLWQFYPSCNPVILAPKFFCPPNGCISYWQSSPTRQNSSLQSFSTDHFEYASWKRHSQVLMRIRKATKKRSILPIVGN